MYVRMYVVCTCLCTYVRMYVRLCISVHAFIAYLCTYIRMAACKPVQMCHIQKQIYSAYRMYLFFVRFPQHD
jgi:hypothetical protein